MDFISGPNNTYGLTVDKATLQDIGTYSVIISNKCGEESNASFVKVIPADKAPVFETQLKPVKVVEGYPAKMEVKVDGYPLPKLEWLVLRISMSSCSAKAVAVISSKSIRFQVIQRRAIEDRQQEY